MVPVWYLILGPICIPGPGWYIKRLIPDQHGYKPATSLAVTYFPTYVGT
jgi:hypothetical protein